MTPVTKAQWIDALRSTQYTQVRGTLVDHDDAGEPTGFCCLGVLASLAGFETVVGDGQSLNPGSSYFNFNGVLDGGVIPAGLRSTIVSDLSLDAKVPPWRSVSDDLMRQLSAMNDRGSSFEEIALYLEQLP